jgi:hypothetical protein
MNTMKLKQSISSRIVLNMICSSLLLLVVFQGYTQKFNNAGKENNMVVAAYVWPSCHDEPMSRQALWSQGLGEWEIIKQGNPRFEGHYQPRVPLWGYQMDDDPVAWKKKINAATDHGVNVLIFDWYWYDGKPFLEEAVDSGFLKAPNSQKMKFYIMWANHDVPGNMWNHFRYKTDSLIWNGEVDWENFRIIVDRVIKQYFKLPNYFKINNEPVFSIYSLAELVQSFNGMEGTRKALDYFRDEVKKAGFPGLHVQLVGNDSNGNPSLLKPQLAEAKSMNEIISTLKINSVTMYNMAAGNARAGDYLRYGECAIKLREKWDSILEVPFFPCISVGWDNTPRYPLRGKESIVYYNNTPESFASYLQKTKEYVLDHPQQPPFLIINAWNEWVEGSYLEPDMLWGYGYLEAVKKVMSGQFDKYSAK